MRAASRYLITTENRREERRRAHCISVGSSWPDTQAFERHLEDCPGAIDIRLRGDTDASPDDTDGRESQGDRNWGVWFVNVGAISQRHVAKTTLLTSRALSAKQSGGAALLYVHTSLDPRQG